jgi:hypothetical protein
MALQIDSPSLVSAGFMDKGDAMNCEKFGSCAIATFLQKSSTKKRIEYL